MNDKFNTDNIKIVLVDDSDFSRSIIKKMLSDAGFQIVGEANSAEKALEVIRDKKPNIVITDIVMPSISGIELTEKINKDYDNISIVVMSSLSQEHIVLEAIGAGASDFIPKPIQEEQLIDSIQKIARQIQLDN